MKDKFGISFPLQVVKNYVTFCFRRYFSEYIVVGRENISADCPLIFAPNHVNALMDALAVHSITPRNYPVTFLARSDLFRNKLMIKVLDFVKILPAFRMRDGVDKLGKNIEIFNKCVEILHQNKGLGIMPEGNQGDERKLRQLAKGIFRIAFNAQEKYGTEPAVKIIPIGIDYGNTTKYGDYVIINIGKPIEISEYFADYNDNPVTTLNEIRDRLYHDLNNITLNYATELYKDCFETTVEVAATSKLEMKKLANNTISRFVARQNITSQLIELEKNKPETMAELNVYCAEYRHFLNKLNVKTSNLENLSSRTFLIIEGISLYCTFPVFLLGYFLNVLPFFTPDIIRKALNVEYKGFTMSLNYTFSLVTFPFFYITQTILFAYFISTTWWIVLCFSVGQYILGKSAFKWYKRAKIFQAEIRLNRLTKNNNSELVRLQELRKKIIQLIND